MLDDETKNKEVNGLKLGMIIVVFLLGLETGFVIERVSHLAGEISGVRSDFEKEDVELLKRIEKLEEHDYEEIKEGK